MIGYIQKFLTVYIVLLTFFLTSLILVSLVPSSLLKENIAETLNTFKKEGIYPSYGLPWRSITLDNFTDSVMVNTAYSVDSNRPVWSALTNTRYVESYDQVDQIKNLEKVYSNTAYLPASYERYWHGYLVYLRPLLTLFSYSGIRNIFAFLLYSTFVWFIFLSWKNLGKKATLSFLIGFIAVDFFFISRSIQFPMVFLIGLFAAIFYLRTYKKNKQPLILFFIVGAFTSFFDLLTAPLVSLGILLIVTTLLGKKRDILFNCLSWSAGYLSLWISKWIIVQYLFIPDAIKVSVNQILNRAVNKPDVNFSHFNAVKLNVFQLLGYNKINKIFILCLFIIFLIFLLRYFSFKKEKIKKIIPWLIIGAIPYIWYLIAANHSYLHVWFTYRAQFMSIVSFFIIMFEFIDWKRVNQDLSFLYSLTE